MGGTKTKEVHQRVVALMCVEDMGHLNPLLALAEVLASGGFVVYFFVPKSVRSRVEATGAIWCHYGSDDWDLYSCAKKVSLQHFGLEPCLEVQTAVLPLATVIATPGVLPFLIGRVAQLQPEFIVFDAACPWAALVGDLLRIPAVCSMTALPMPQKDREVVIERFSAEGQQAGRQAAAALKAAYGVDYNPSYGYANYAPYTIVWSSRQWHKGHADFDEAQFAYWGPITSARPGVSTMSADLPNGPLVFVSFGTVATGHKFTQFEHVFRDAYSKICAVAASMPKVSFLIAIGKGLPAVETPAGDITALFDNITLPPNVLAARSVDQVSVLGRASAFVTHCGQNSCSEAVLAGVPVVACPFFGDQHDNAARFEELGCGIIQSYFSRGRPADADLEGVTEASLADALRRLLEEPRFAAAMAEVRARQAAEVGRPMPEKIEEMLAHVAERSRSLGVPLFPAVGS